MKVYILYRDFGFGDRDLIGVFATRALAENSSLNVMNAEIEEHDVVTETEEV